MTIESKIDKLITAIEELTAAMTGNQKAAPVLVQPAQPATETVTAEDLQALCTTIVRKDRSKKAQIVATLAAYDNAKLISDIPAVHYSAIKTKLEAINE